MFCSDLFQEAFHFTVDRICKHFGEIQSPEMKHFVDTFFILACSWTVRGINPNDIFIANQECLHHIWSGENLVVKTTTNFRSIFTSQPQSSQYCKPVDNGTFITSLQSGQVSNISSIHLSFEFQSNNVIAVSAKGFLQVDRLEISPLRAEYEGGSISYAEYLVESRSNPTTGIGTSRYFMVEWSNMKFRNGELDFKLVLNENETFIFIYDRIPEGFLEMRSQNVSTPVVGLFHNDQEDECLDLSHLEISNNSMILFEEKSVCYECSRGPGPSSKVVEDNHVFYLQLIYNDKSAYEKYHVDLDLYPSEEFEWLKNTSKSATAYETERFTFYYYGHTIEKLFVTTEGFLSLSPGLHEKIHAFQYIAPLQANFDLSLSTESTVRYLETNTSVVFQWEGMKLAENPDAGSFTFQVILERNNDIIFVYETIPMNVTRIKDVKAGINDAFILKKEIIYEYHKIDVNLDLIQNGTVIKFKSRKTCNQLKDCNSCLTTKLSTFDCYWCPSAGQCSSGWDRKREQWETHICHIKNVTNSDYCLLLDKVSETHKFYNSTTIVKRDVINQMWTVSPLFKKLDAFSKKRITLSFAFPFYGYDNHVVYISPEYGTIDLHYQELSFMSHKRYISPLGGVMKVQKHVKGSRIAYLSESDQFIVEWNLVSLFASPLNKPTSTISMQARFDKFGTISFVYSFFEGDVDTLKSNYKIELSDSFEDDRFSHPFSLEMFNVENFVPYHEINMMDKLPLIPLSIAINFTLLPSCPQQKSCHSCLHFEGGCRWCPTIKSCSGSAGQLDRLTSSWRRHQCEKHHVTQETLEPCPAPIIPSGHKIYEHDYKYYKTVILNDPVEFARVWVNMTKEDDVRVLKFNTDMTSSASRPYNQVGEEITLDFDFPFYGHFIRNIRVMNTGFISLPTIQHEDNADSQYIAPLMANFGTSGSRSEVKVQRNSMNATVISWENLVLKFQEGLGSYSFQASLRADGEITFAYKNLPKKIDFIDDAKSKHPVKIGLSDAYDVENVSLRDNMKIWNSFIYHEIDMLRQKDKISNKSIIVFKPLPTCHQYSSCWECTTGKTSFECQWCPVLGMCSTGMDRNKQIWLDNSCSFNRNSAMVPQDCPAELIRSNHTFYNRTVHILPNKVVRELTASYNNTIVVEKNQDFNFLKTRLEFDFQFFDKSFREVFIHPNGFVGFGTRNGDEQLSIVAPFKNISYQGDTNISISHTSLKTEFRVHWLSEQASFEMTLKRTNSIVFDYFNVSAETANSAEILVGIGSVLNGGSSVSKEMFQINTPHYHIRSGLTILFDHLKDYCYETEECSQCMGLSKCQWCGDKCIPNWLLCNAEKNCNSSPNIFLTVSICLLVILAFSLIAFILIRHAIRNPTSYAGQILVRWRVRSYRLFHQSNEYENHQSSASRRGSLITTDSTVHAFNT